MAPHWVVPPAKRLRDFRADRIKSLINTQEKFDRRNLLTLQDYLQTYMQSHRDLQKVIITFDKSMFRHRHYLYGFISEEDLGDKVRMTVPGRQPGLAGPLAPVLWSDRGN